MEGDGACFTSANREPMLLRVEVVARAPCRHGDGRVVLLGAIEAVWEGVVYHHAVQLCRGLVVVGRPAFAGVDTHLCPAVVGNNLSVTTVGAITDGPAGSLNVTGTSTLAAGAWPLL